MVPCEISFLLPLHAAGRPAEDTLLTLSAAHQRNVHESDYEIVVAERASDYFLGEARVTQFGGNVRYLSRPAAEQPIESLYSAFEHSAGALIGVIEGPCVVTPRLVEHAIAAARLHEQPLIVVPSFRLPADADPNMSELMASSASVYDLFENAGFDAVNPQGYLSSLVESRLFFVARATLAALFRDPNDARFETCDDLFGKLTTLAHTRLIVLGGEGCIPRSSAARAVASGRNLRARFRRQPLLYGVVPGQLNELFRTSIGHAAMHAALARKQARTEWRHDPAVPALDTRANTDLAAADAPQPRAPRLSIVVVIFRIPNQAENTIHSLSPRYQCNVGEDDYEIIVVENRSPEMLGEERARRIARNVRYFARDEAGVSPAPALNFGAARARGELLGLMVDGARMATPRIVEHVLLARRIDPRPLVVAPGFYLGPGPQHVTARQGYDSAAEQHLLESIDWKLNGYGLFEIGVFDEASTNGFLNPLLECTCLFCAKTCFDEIGGMDERFDLVGGGDVNLDLFDRLCRLERTKYFVLWSEGSFHQFHGGVSTGGVDDRETQLDAFRRQYDALRGRRYATHEREPTLLGTCAGRAHQRLMEAVALGRVRYDMKRAAGEPEWPNR